VMLGAHLLDMLKVFQAGLELESGGDRSYPVFSVQHRVQKHSMG
jgi:hypothetical protein